VVVTAGDAGAYLARHGQNLVHVAAPRVDPIDTTGAGDSFIGAFVTSIRRGDALEEAVRFGVRVASRSVVSAGSIDSYPTLAQLDV
jgi:ribokinase